MSGKSLNVRYIYFSEKPEQKDSELFLEKLDAVDISEYKILFKYIEKEFPISGKKKNPFEIRESDLYKMDDKSGIEVKNYIISLCTEAVNTIIYPLVNYIDIRDLNIADCFALEVNGEIMVGTTATSISFGNNNFINKAHLLIYLLKRFDFNKVINK